MATTGHDSEIEGPLLDVLREAYLARANGTIEVDGGKLGVLYMRRGEICFDRDSRHAEVVQANLEAAEGEALSSSDADLRTFLGEVAGELAPDDGRHPSTLLRRDSSGGIEVVGPVPTAALLLELADRLSVTVGSDALLGDPSRRFQTCNETPALDQLPGLDASMTRALVLLEQPMTLGQMIAAARHHSDAVQGLVRLWAVGLVAEVRSDNSEIGGERAPFLSSKVVSRFVERVGESLDSEPLDMPASEHRQMLVRFFSELADHDHYELLGVSPDAGEGEVLAAYNKLARQLHPSHAGKLGLAGKEEAVGMLFERATEAYLTLSDPRRRSSYNNLMGLHAGVVVDHVQRLEEKRALARQNYLQGSSYLAQMDYSMAVELLKEAARMDPKAEYFARLGQAQAKNPKWRRHAVRSYRQASNLDPENGGYRLGYAQMLEHEGQLDAARGEYREALARLPENPQAQAGLDRLGGAAPEPEGGRRRRLRNILGRGSK